MFGRIKSYEFKGIITLGFLLLFMMLILSATGCTRKGQEAGETQANQTTQAPEVTQVTAPPDKPRLFAVEKDVAIGIKDVSGALIANSTVKIAPPKIEEIVVTEVLQQAVDFLRKGYTDLASISIDYPNLLATKTEVYGETHYTVSDVLSLSVYSGNHIMLQSQAINTSIHDISYVTYEPFKAIPPYTVIKISDFLVLLNEQGRILRAYTLNQSGEHLYYGDFLGDEGNELALVFRYSQETHFYTFDNDRLVPIVLNDLYHEIDTQTQAKLTNRAFDVSIKHNPDSPVTSEAMKHTSTLPDKFYLNITGGTMEFSPLLKYISTVIDPETLRAVISCRWMWSNGLAGDITLAEIIYRFEEPSIDSLKQHRVDMRYAEHSRVNRAIEHSEVVLTASGSVVLDTNASITEQLQYFDVNEPLELPGGDGGGNMDLTQHYFERSGLDLDVAFFDEMLGFYTLKITSPDYVLGGLFKVGMSQEDVLENLGVPDLENNRLAFEKQEWSYYVKNETGELLLNFYYGHKKVVFVFDGESVIEIRVEAFASPT